ncbi:MAG TPA: trypsin-like peptidase domain-containing protein [Gemmatimonadales bacterium]|nr:trypsin-like peptidase domain-containing protein [Gemmatimonadales bacterium]
MKIQNRSSVVSAVLAMVLVLAPAAARADSPGAQAALPSLAPMIESVKGAVVNVDVQSRVNRAEMQGGDLFDLFRRRRGGSEPSEPLAQGKGSGVIIDGRGMVLTNNHVVQDAVLIRVTLEDGRGFDAETVGRDPATDVALIRLKGKLDKLPVAKLGDSDALKVGDWVFAIGNPFGLASSVSLGIISAKARNITGGQYDDFLQTDAAINPGNSGGPLFNLRGEVMGINTAIAGNGSGIGFAVPANLARALIPQLEKEGGVTRGWLGIGIQTVTAELGTALGVPAQEGAVVLQVNDGSPARRAGLKQDDVIVALDGAKIATSDALTRMIALKRPGSTSSVEYFRGGKRLEAKVTLGTRPDSHPVSRAPSRERPSDENNKQRVGVTLQDVDPSFANEMGIAPQGAMVADIVPGSVAERADLTRGMVIVEADRHPIKSSAELTKLLRTKRPGEVLLLRIATPGGQGGTALRALTMP